MSGGAKTFFPEISESASFSQIFRTSRGRHVKVRGRHAKVRGQHAERPVSVI